MKLKHYLIATPENHYRPWILTKTAMACFVVGIWALRAFLPVAIPDANANQGIDPSDLMSRVNAERTQRFIPALVTSPKLNAAAQIKSADMIARSYFAHVNPDGQYVWPVIEAQGYAPYKALGENLAMDFQSAEAAVAAWMNSPGHRANILNEKFEDQGMAAVFGEFEPGHDTYAITNLFGSLMKVAQATVPTPTPTPTPTPPVQAPAPTPTPTPTPTQSQAPTPTPSIQPQATPSPSQATPTPTPEPTEAEAIPATTTTGGDTQSPDGESPAVPTAGTSPVTSADRTGLTALQIVLAVFAGIYTLFLLIDSVIIHRAKLDRENMPSSPHALMMLLVSAVNFITIFS